MNDRVGLKSVQETICMLEGVDSLKYLGAIIGKTWDFFNM